MSRKTKSELSFLFKISLLFTILYVSKVIRTETATRSIDLAKAGATLDDAFFSSFKIAKK